MSNQRMHGSTTKLGALKEVSNICSSRKTPSWWNKLYGLFAVLIWYPHGIFKPKRVQPLSHLPRLVRSTSASHPPLPGAEPAASLSQGPRFGASWDWDLRVARHVEPWRPWRLHCEENINYQRRKMWDSLRKYMALSEDLLVVGFSRCHKQLACGMINLPLLYGPRWVKAWLIHPKVAPLRNE